jgi:complement component 1 Q subcomponent-binding protein
MFSATRHSLRRAVSRAAVVQRAGGFARGACCVGEPAGARSVSPSAVDAVAKSRSFERGFFTSPLARDETAAASAPPVSAKGLSQVLGEELEHERTTYVPSEIVTKGPPAPFEIIESDGDCEITLTRTFGEDEEIAVTFNATEDPYEDEYELDTGEVGGGGDAADDEDEDVTIHFSVSVSRGDGHQGLEFSCATDGETVEVRNVRYVLGLSQIQTLFTAPP